MDLSERDLYLFKKAGKALQSFNYSTVTLKGEPIFRLEMMPEETIAVKRFDDFRKEGKDAPAIFIAGTVKQAFEFMRSEEQRERREGV